MPEHRADQVRGVEYHREPPAPAAAVAQTLAVPLRRPQRDAEAGRGPDGPRDEEVERRLPDALDEENHRREAAWDGENQMLESAEQRHAHLRLALGSACGAHDRAVDPCAAVCEEPSEARGHDGEPVGVAQIVGPAFDLPDAAVAEVVADERQGDSTQRGGQPRP